MNATIVSGSYIQQRHMIRPQNWKYFFHRFKTFGIAGSCYIQCSA